MEKIISLFKRDYAGNRQVINEIVSGAEWIIAGEGIATRKYDGTCCLIKAGKFYKRREIKKGQKAPKDFTPTTSVDPITGKQQGWVPVGDGPEGKYHREAFESQPDGTYELLGPQVQGNPEGYDRHILIAHANAEKYPNFPRDFNGIKEILSKMNIEGVVWHHPDGRMVKIKAKDFGITRKECDCGPAQLFPLPGSPEQSVG